VVKSPQQLSCGNCVICYKNKLSSLYLKIEGKKRDREKRSRRRRRRTKKRLTLVTVVHRNTERERERKKGTDGTYPDDCPPPEWKVNLTAESLPKTRTHKTQHVQVSALIHTQRLSLAHTIYFFLFICVFVLFCCFLSLLFVLLLLPSQLLCLFFVTSYFLLL
jgi:hypothetical protein